jgi:hypothetical protein
MASIKNFGIQGVGSDVQFGKAGNRLVSEAGTFRVVNSANAAVRVVVANAVSATDAVALGQLTAAVATVQNELDATQAGAGLSTTGAYVPNATGNYISGATSLADAANKIDAALKAADLAYKAADTQIRSDIANVASVAQQADATQQNLINGLRSDLSNESNARIAADTIHDTRLTQLEANATQSASQIAAELDRVEAAVGLDSDGNYVATPGAHYTQAATTVVGAVAALDAALNAADVAYKAADSAINANVANVAANLASLASSTTANAVSQQAGIDANLAAIQAEVTRATGVEAGLQTQVTNEVSRATTAENAIANSVLIETVRAQGAEATIANSVTAEVSRATAAEGVLTTNLAAEVTRATNVEAGLRTDLTTLETRVTNLGNVFEYKGLISDLDLTKIVSPGIGDYYKVATSGTFTGANGFSIVANVGDGLVFNGTNYDKIDNTDSAVFGTANAVTVTGSSDVGYTVDIAQTFKDRLASVESKTGVDTSSLQTQINNLTANTANSIARIDGVDAAQNAALALEANARQAADSLNANAITNEASRATAAEAALNSLISNAVTAYQAADATLTTNLNTEITNRTNADAALQAELDRTQTGAGLAANGSYIAASASNYIANATSLADADSKLDAAIKSVQTNLNNLSQDEIHNSTNLYAVKTTASAVELYGDKGSVKTKMGQVVTGAAQNSTFEIDLATANEVRFEAHSDTATNVDIRLVPQGSGQVVVGETGTNGVIQADNGYDLTLAGGDQAGGQAGNLVLTAGGGATNGKVLVKDGSGNTVLAVSAGNAATNAVISGSATAVTFAADGSASNVDVVLAPKGTGSVSASNAKIVAVANGTAPTDAVNVSQLQTAVSSAQTAATSGSHRSVSAAITETNGSVALGTVNGTAVRVKVVVTSAFSAGASITVGRAGATAELVASSDVDEAAVGMYVIELAKDYTSTGITATVVAGSGSTGTAKVYVEYISA